MGGECKLCRFAGQMDHLPPSQVNMRFHHMTQNNTQINTYEGLLVGFFI